MSRAKWISAAKRVCLALPFSRPSLSKIGSILTFHRITNERIQPGSFVPMRPLLVHCSDFETQIKFLSEEYRCLSLKDGIDALKSGSLPERAVFITFDDGYRDTLEYALPILEKYNVPAAIFVTVGFINGTSNPWWLELEYLLSLRPGISYNSIGPVTSLNTRSVAEKTAAYRRINRALMRANPKEQEAVLEALREGVPKMPRCSHHFLNWKETIELSRHPLITIGSHTMSHPVLSSLSSSELVYELARSKSVLEEHLGREVSFLGYPFGSPGQAGPREYQAAEGAGYEAAFTTIPENFTPLHRQSLFSLPRIDITYGESVTDLKWKLKGFDTLIRRYAIGNRMPQGGPPLYVPLSSQKIPLSSA